MSMIVIKGMYDGEFFSVPVESVEAINQNKDCYAVVYLKNHKYSIIKSSWSLKKLTRKINKLRKKENK